VAIHGSVCGINGRFVVFCGDERVRAVVEEKAHSLEASLVIPAVSRVQDRGYGRGSPASVRQTKEKIEPKRDCQEGKNLEETRGMETREKEFYLPRYRTAVNSGVLPR
jgi:hypothetical protein